MVGHVSMEVAKTVIEVADVAWTAVEHCNHHRHHDAPKPSPPESKEDIESIRAENERLRMLLEKNLNLLKEISSSPTLMHDCPSDLHDRLLSTVKSGSFLNELESLRQKSTCTFPFDEPSGADMEKAEVLINIDHEEPSWWVWVSDDIVPKNTEEKSEIDNENYVIVTEEHVVDGVATFMARCILANPKSMNLTSLELQKALMKALEGMNKVEKMLNIWHAGKLFYTLAMWGLTLASLYQGRAILRLATLGVHHSSKAALKIL
ncbi:elongation factor [Perilla frutescens var. hirtella]|uniref:Elongation factor n=1 Tax=Perilla frutescens var. hirtella TaxID=608512 RepID=A0AAD4JK57_PERFH|nr:elongation factor [Perilla frutescens var. hirtella]